MKGRKIRPAACATTATIRKTVPTDWHKHSNKNNVAERDTLMLPNTVAVRIRKPGQACLTNTSKSKESKDKDMRSSSTTRSKQQTDLPMFQGSKLEEDNTTGTRRNRCEKGNEAIVRELYFGSDIIQTRGTRNNSFQCCQHICFSISWNALDVASFLLIWHFDSGRVYAMSNPSIARVHYFEKEGKDVSYI